MNLKERILLDFKNLIGWRTRRKIVVFSIDDYGNVRLHSRAAREAMDKAGLKVYSRFDAHDTLETSQDLEILFEALSSVKDKNNRSAVFTPFALPCNIDFETMAAEGFQQYRYESLTETHKKLATMDPVSYGSAGTVLKQGIAEGIFKPQFHGREHLNLAVFEEKLKNRDRDLLTALRNRSFTSISYPGNKIVSPAAAFAFWNNEETRRFPDILQTGLDAFQAVYGYRARVFTPPTQQFPESLEPSLRTYGIDIFDKPFFMEKHVGNGKYSKSFAVTGYKKKTAMATLVRNVVFEPTSKKGVDWAAYASRQVDAAFRWNRPAIISSHRVNFCGYIDPKNREKGINDLRSLLKTITRQHPDVEFMAADELGNIIMASHKHI